MKPKPKQIAACSTLYFGCAASVLAQGSVTLYGVLDDAIAYTNNQKGHSNIYMLQGSLSSTRFGLRGSEALSSTTKAIFQMEAGFDPNTGKEASAGLEFNRQVWVGLQDSTAGTFTLGRQYSPYWSLLNTLGPVPSLTGATGAHPGDIDALDTTVRINNSIKYTTAAVGGLTASAQYGVGGTPGSMQSGSEYSAAIQYLGKHLNFALGYLKLYNSNTSSGFNTTTSGNIGVSPINTGYITAHDIQHVAALANYIVGPALVGVSYTNVSYRPDARSGFTNTAVFNTFAFLTRYTLHKNIDLAVGYSYTAASRANGIDHAATYHQISMKQAYRFSKRTTIYCIEAWQRANGKTLGSGGAGDIIAAAPAVGDAENSSPSSTKNQFLAALGLAVAF